MKLTVLACENCNDEELYIPPKYVCPKCYEKSFKEIEIESNGVIYSYTNIYAATEKFLSEAPYYVILVELDNVGLVTARLTGGEPNIGDKVSLSRMEDNVYWFSLES